eukprot:CAMPEP_0114429316 /NCGR_PEP_ID=MMETSP0103-20121206/9413_1 /TAXON_ID=37642 ORGANISM="Paraphysomonas imperforata, Strain PA2" /NCGR_SAMPLE_ID=MMETSP0103 /ASSEMBLY_ACC=CAM_ASM_000201 /LENGTH=1280 /DNA_ID=CAMNT_0001598629 /DNA_START=214 /DNA_END=4056 /DNA_ORIENTATION=+
MEFEVTRDQMHCVATGVFGSPVEREGRRVHGASTSSLFVHISQAQGSDHTPLRQATTKIHELYKRCNPAFKGSGGADSRIPARVLTQPSEPLSDAVPYDNKEGNLIARVYDVIEVPGASYHYTIMDLLGTGTFGQVFRCLKEPNEDVDNEAGRRKPSEVVAVKVVKGKPAYRTQGLLEVKIAKMVNQIGDPEDRHHLVRVKDSFESRGHVCIVFELLSCSLLDVLTQNQFRGLPLEVVQRFTVQLLSALAVLQDTNIIHCDLKPENILLCPKSAADSESDSKSGAAQDSASPTQKGAVDIKVIDFGSACFEGKTMYSYIQSRFYRSPEVLLGVPYNGAIDIWSLGCVCAEMYLGLPLFPGASQHNQLTRIVDMLGNVPDFLVEHGKNSEKFFVQLAPSAPLPSYSLLPVPFSLPPPQFASSKSGAGKDGGHVKSSSSLGSILPAALREGGMQVSSFMNTLVSGAGNTSSHGARRVGGTSDDSSIGKDHIKKHSTNHSHNFRLKSAEEYAAANNQQVPTFRKYLRYDKLDDIIMKCPLPNGTSSHMTSEQKKKEHYRRKCFLDFLKGLLNLNPFDRLTAQQAMEHPFVAKYFNKKSKIGTVRVKAPSHSNTTSPRSSRSHRRHNDGVPDNCAKNEGEAPHPEFIEKRIFLPPYDEKVSTRISSYQNKMQEALSFVVSPSHLMGRNNVCLNTMKKAEAAKEQAALTSVLDPATAVAGVGNNEAGVETSTNSSLDSLINHTASLFVNGKLTGNLDSSKISPTADANVFSNKTILSSNTTTTMGNSNSDGSAEQKDKLVSHNSSDVPQASLPLASTSTGSQSSTVDAINSIHVSKSSQNSKSSASNAMGVSPGGLMTALLQATPIVEESERGSHQLQQDPKQQHDAQYYMQYQYQPPHVGQGQPRTPPSSLASSYDNVGQATQGIPAIRDSIWRGSSEQFSQGSSTQPIPMPQTTTSVYDLAGQKLATSPQSESTRRGPLCGTGMSRSSNSALSSVFQNGGAASIGGGAGNSLSGSLSSSIFNGSGSLEFGNILGGVSSGSSLSSNTSFPGTPTRQQLSHQFPSQSPGYTPTGSLNSSSAAFILGSPSTSTGEFGQSLQRPELDESRYLQSFGFQQHRAHDQGQRRRLDRSQSISDNSYQYNGNDKATFNNENKRAFNPSITSSGTWLPTSGLETGIPSHPSVSNSSWTMAPPGDMNWCPPPSTAMNTGGSNNSYVSLQQQSQQYQQQNQMNVHLQQQHENPQLQHQHHHQDPQLQSASAVQGRSVMNGDDDRDDDEALFDCDD